MTNVGVKAYGVHIFTNAGTTAFTPSVTVYASYLIVGGGEVAEEVMEPHLIRRPQ